MPTANDDVTETEEATPARAASPSDTDEEEDLPPPALIVRLRKPDRPASHTIGAPAPEHVGPGASVTFGLSVAGRSAERAAVGATTRVKTKDNVLSVPHPRLEARPTRVATDDP